MYGVRCSMYDSPMIANSIILKQCVMDAEEMKKRTKSFAINVAKLTLKLPSTYINKVYGGQLVRSGSSAGANYRASRRAKSKPDFINKLKIVEEELDESLFFLELLLEFNAYFKKEIIDLYLEGETLLKIIVASIVSSRQG